MPFLPDFKIGRGSGCAKPLRSTARARTSYDPDDKPWIVADHETML